MIATLILIWVGFNIASDGLFLSPRNLWNLSVQTSAVAVMATGMVLIIVSRNIDLSVGSIVGVVGMFMAPPVALAHPDDSRPRLRPAVHLDRRPSSSGLALGRRHRGAPGRSRSRTSASRRSSSRWAGCSSGAPSRSSCPRADRLPTGPDVPAPGRRPKGSVGETVSWIIGMAVCRRHRLRAHLEPSAPPPLRLPGAPAVGRGRPSASSAASSCSGPSRSRTAIPGQAAREQFAAEHGIPSPEGGLIIPTGIANPVLIALGVALLMTILATRRRFGRYVFAIGGNPEAAELSGINTRRIIMRTFVIMGVLAAVSASSPRHASSRRRAAAARARSSRSSPPPSSAARRSRAASAPSREPPGRAHHPVPCVGHAALRFDNSVLGHRRGRRAGGRGRHRHRRRGGARHEPSRSRRSPARPMPAEAALRAARGDARHPCRLRWRPRRRRTSP